MSSVNTTEVISAPGLPDVPVPPRPASRAARIRSRLTEIHQQIIDAESAAGDPDDLAVQEALQDQPAVVLARRRQAADKLAGLRRDAAALDRAAESADREDQGELLAWRSRRAAAARETWIDPLAARLREELAAVQSTLNDLQRAFAAGNGPLGLNIGLPIYSTLAPLYLPHGPVGLFLKEAGR